jgi:hypothetical protein
MTQKEQIVDRLHKAGHITLDEVFTLLDKKDNTWTTPVNPSPTIPWTTPPIFPDPYYPQSPYTITCNDKWLNTVTYTSKENNLTIAKHLEDFIVRQGSITPGPIVSGTINSTGFLDMSKNNIHQCQQ